MKYLIAVVMLAALVSAEYTVKTREDMLKYREDCITEHNVPPDHVEKYKKWDFPDDATTHCYMMCILEKFELFDKDHGYNVANVHTQMVGGPHPDQSDEIRGKIVKCADKNTQGSPVCEWAYRGARCFVDENLQLVKSSVQADDQNQNHAHHHGCRKNIQNE